MDELSSFETDRLDHVRRIVEVMYSGLVSKVIADIKSLPDNCRQSTQPKDVWEEFKYQVQEEQSVFFDFYETHDSEDLQPNWLQAWIKSSNSYYGSGARRITTGTGSVTNTQSSRKESWRSCLAEHGPRQTVKN